jgi:hypothetical protein
MILYYSLFLGLILYKLLPDGEKRKKRRKHRFFF